MGRRGSRQAHGAPPWIGQTPAESQRVFQPCVEGTFRVRARRTPPGDVEVWVHDGVDHIWIEPEYLERAILADTSG
jgi:hypothetical protein